MRIREISIGVLLSGVLAAVVALTIPEPEPVTLAAPAPVAAPLPAAAPAPRAQARLPPAAAASGSANTRWLEVHGKYVRAQSLREFFYDAVRKPVKGAIYYATQALDVCERALEQDPAALPPARRQAAAELQRRCDFTQDGLRDARRELRAARHLDPEGDAVLDTMARYLGADDAEGRAAMLGAAFEQGNPDIIVPLAAVAVVANLPAGSSASSAAFGDALVVCRLGAECGPGAIRTLELCMQFGWCADSVPAALQQGMGRHFTVVEKVAAQVVRDLRRAKA